MEWGDAIRQVAVVGAAGVALATLPAPASYASPVAGVMSQGSSVTIALASEPNTFDPHLTVGRNTQIFIANVFDGLTARDPSGQLTPALATDWGVLADGSGWQVTLREGVTCHNGEPFTASAVNGHHRAGHRPGHQVDY